MQGLFSMIERKGKHHDGLKVKHLQIKGKFGNLRLLGKR